MDRSPDGFCKWAMEEYTCKILIDAKVELREAEGAEGRLLGRQAARGWPGANIVGVVYDGV